MIDSQVSPPSPSPQFCMYVCICMYVCMVWCWDVIIKIGWHVLEEKHALVILYTTGITESWDCVMLCNWSFIFSRRHVQPLWPPVDRCPCFIKSHYYLVHFQMICLLSGVMGAPTIGSIKYFPFAQARAHTRTHARTHAHAQAHTHAHRHTHRPPIWDVFFLKRGD